MVHILCSSRKYPYPPPNGRSLEIPKGMGGGGGGVQRLKFPRKVGASSLAFFPEGGKQFIMNEILLT